jgi:hypothetical protein
MCGDCRVIDMMAAPGEASIHDVRDGADGDR